MKKILTLLAVGTGLLVFTAAPAEARDSHGHGHLHERQYAHRCSSCGTAIYRERVRSYDRHGHVSYGWHTVSHRCRGSHGHGDYGHGHGSSHSTRGGRGHSDSRDMHGRSSRH